jgi:alkylated DNA repair dioxygenase AlkB
MDIATETCLSTSALFGDDLEAESQGSRIYHHLLSADDASAIFDDLNREITWQAMHHQQGVVPRRVCCQASMNPIDNSTPIYRHPSDRTMPTEPWTPTVDWIRSAAVKLVGHELNHALIQLYRSGNDFISEHSDKTLDIVPGSYIVNVSFGAQRTMRLRTKREPRVTIEESTRPLDTQPLPQPALRTTHRVPLPHNSMIAMTLETNARYLHGINADKRLAFELSEKETAFDGQRISLTFRQIGTFLSEDGKRIWGQGATSKRKEDAKQVICGDEAESEKLIHAFGKENVMSVRNWEECYGAGSDVLHLKG